MNNADKVLNGVSREMLERVFYGYSSHVNNAHCHPECDGLDELRALLDLPYWREMRPEDVKFPIGFISGVSFHEGPARPPLGVEVILLEAVGNVIEGEEGLEVDWTLEGGLDALEGPAQLVVITDGHVGADWYAGEFVSREDYEALKRKRLRSFTMARAFYTEMNDLRAIVGTSVDMISEARTDHAELSAALQHVTSLLERSSANLNPGGKLGKEVRAFLKAWRQGGESAEVKP